VIIIKKLLVTAVLLFFVNGCSNTTTTTGYKQIMKTWIGASEKALIRSRGNPDSTYTSDGSKFLEYNRSYTSKERYYSSYDFNSDGGSGYSYPIGGDTYSCKTTYEIKDGKVLKIRWAGNNCKAKEKKESGKSAKIKKINKKSYDDYVF